MRRLVACVAVAAAAMLPGAALAQDGDAAAGQRMYNAQCRACHTPEQGGRNGVGPNLWGVFGRRAGEVEGFRYSARMRALAEGGLTWNEERLRAFLTNPREVVPGGSMAFAGIRNPEHMNNMIAYIKTLR